MLIAPVVFCMLKFATYGWPYSTTAQLMHRLAASLTSWSSVLAVFEHQLIINSFAGESIQAVLC